MLIGPIRPVRPRRLLSAIRDRFRPIRTKSAEPNNDQTGYVRMIERCPS